MTKAGVDAAAAAYARIRHEIVTGVLAENERLTERSLSERLGLSRTPIRAAIARLAHEGFIEQGKGYSTRVARFPEDELEQIFQLRLHLEGFAARRAAQFADGEQKKNLHRLATRMTELTPPANADEHNELSSCNEQFHQLIAQAARSPRLLAMLAVAVDVGVVARTYKLYSEADLQRSSRHHHEIADAIQAGSPDWAESVMRSHLLAAQALVQRT